MSLAPLLAAPLTIQIHAVSAIAAFGLGAVQLCAPKGVLPHRVLGWVWVGLMVLVAGSSLVIRSAWPLIGPFGPIHILSVWVLLVLPRAVQAARSHAVLRHRTAMVHPVHRRAGDRRRPDLPARAHHARGGLRVLKG